MPACRFTVIILGPQLTHDEILEATDSLADAGCTDASIGGHSEGMELLFERDANSLQAALSSAVADIERAGFQVSRVEVERSHPDLAHRPVTPSPLRALRRSSDDRRSP